MTEVFKKLPGVLSLNRCIVATDALFFNLHEDSSRTPLYVTRSGLRGTQNINKTGANARDEVSNIQVTDTAKSSPDAVGVVVILKVGYHPIEKGLNSCALSKKDPEELLQGFRASYEGFIERANTSEGLRQVSCRFARNIANGRWLWRNRKLAVGITIKVIAGDQQFTFDALSIPLNTFGEYSANELALGELIRDSLAGDNFTPLEITATLDFGKGLNAGIEVYPSQNYMGGDKPKGFARSLYAVGSKPRINASDLLELSSAHIQGQAAIRDTKAANALRTIDTWYPDYESYGQPIAVEPAGANLEAQRIFRTGQNTAFAYAKQLNVIDPDEPRGMFMIASLVRGGVFSEGGDS